MAAGETQIPSIPAPLMAELEKIARAQGRPVSQLIADAIDHYLRDEQWQRLKGYGQAGARATGKSEDDVERLIDEFRKQAHQAR